MQWLPSNNNVAYDHGTIWLGLEIASDEHE